MNPLLLIFIGIVAEVIIVLVDKVSLGLTFVGCAGEEMSVEDEAKASKESQIEWHCLSVD